MVPYQKKNTKRCFHNLISSIFHESLSRERIIQHRIYGNNPVIVLKDYDELNGPRLTSELFLYSSFYYKKSPLKELYENITSVALYFDIEFKFYCTFYYIVKNILDIITDDTIIGFFWSSLNFISGKYKYENKITELQKYLKLIFPSQIDIKVPKINKIYAIIYKVLARNCDKNKNINIAEYFLISTQLLQELLSHGSCATLDDITQFIQVKFENVNGNYILTPETVNELAKGLNELLMKKKIWLLQNISKELMLTSRIFSLLKRYKNTSNLNKFSCIIKEIVKDWLIELHDVLGVHILYQGLDKTYKDTSEDIKNLKMACEEFEALYEIEDLFNN